MRTNGTLRYEIIDDASVTLNEYGEPTQAVVSVDNENDNETQQASEPGWSDPINCSISVNSDNRIGKYEDGEFHVASYTILIETMNFEHGRIQLTRDGISLGEYRVMSVIPLKSVGRTQIIV